MPHFCLRWANNSDSFGSDGKHNHTFDIGKFHEIAEQSSSERTWLYCTFIPDTDNPFGHVFIRQYYIMHTIIE